MALYKIGSITAHRLFGLIAPEPIHEPTPSKLVEVEDNITDMYYESSGYKIRMVFSETETGETYTTEVIPL